MESIKIKDRIINYEIDSNRCWNVKNCPTSRYARIRLDCGIMSIHRAVYIFNVLKVDSLSKDKLVLHSCDNTRCINPEHLRIGSASENMADKIKRHKMFSKLTNKDISQIKNLSRFVTQEKLSNLFGVSQSTISNIINNKSIITI